MTKSDGSASQPQPVAMDQLARANTANGPSDPSSTRSERWVCAARQRGITLDPQDCDWPVCGCDPLANKVLDTITESGFVIVPKDGAPMTDDQIKHMVDRFLMWKLPKRLPALTAPGATLSKRQMLECILLSLNVDGVDLNGLTVGELRRAL